MTVQLLITHSRLFISWQASGFSFFPHVFTQFLLCTSTFCLSSSHRASLDRLSDSGFTDVVCAAA